MMWIFRLFVFTAVIALLVPWPAPAKTIEEVLKEKGVITEAEYREVSASQTMTYVPGKGFTFTSPDRKFELSLGGRIQFQYQYLDREIGQDVSQWRNRRFKVYMGGYAFTNDLTYRVQVDLVKSGTPQMLEEAWINYRILDEAQAQGGQFKVPFLREELISDGALQFVDRANVVDAFKPSYDIGAMAWGRVAKDLLTYNAGIFGGAGQSQVRTGNSGALAFRLVANPLGEVRYTESDLENTPGPRFSIGADYFMNTLQKNGRTTFVDTSSSTPPYAGSSGWLGMNAAVFDNTEKVDIQMVSVDAAFKWLGLSAQGEYMYGDSEGQTTHRKAKASGIYAQAGYLVIPKHLEVAARWTWFDPNIDVNNDLQVQFQGAVSYYFYDHNLKVQGDYTNIHTQRGAGRQSTDDKQVRLQAQLAF